MIDIARDYPGLRIAARELLEEAFQKPDADAMLRNSRVVDPIEMYGKRMPKRSVSPGYYRWVEYLLWLQSIVQVGVQLEFQAVEVEGLIIVDSAQNQFRRTHPSCSRCGALNEAQSPACRKCFHEFPKD